MNQDTKGRVFLDCPNCHLQHHIRKQSDHIKKKRFRCHSCGCTWPVTDVVRDSILKAYGLDGKKDESSENTVSDKPKSLAATIFGKR